MGYQTDAVLDRDSSPPRVAVAGRSVAYDATSRGRWRRRYDCQVYRPQCHTGHRTSTRNSFAGLNLLSLGSPYVEASNNDQTLVSMESEDETEAFQLGCF